MHIKEKALSMWSYKKQSKRKTKSEEEEEKEFTFTKKSRTSKKLIFAFYAKTQRLIKKPKVTTQICLPRGIIFCFLEINLPFFGSFIKKCSTKILSNKIIFKIKNGKSELIIIYLIDINVNFKLKKYKPNLYSHKFSNTFKMLNLQL